MTFRRILAGALAATAIAAPAATAAQHPDMHASTAIAAAKAQQRQDLRGEHARDAAQRPRPAQASLLLASPGHPGESASAPVLPPVTAQATTSDDGVNWTTIGLGVAGTLLVFGGIVALTIRRPLPRTRVSA